MSTFFFLLSCFLCFSFLFAGILRGLFQKRMIMAQRVSLLLPEQESSRAQLETKGDVDPANLSFKQRVIGPQWEKCRTWLSDRMPSAVQEAVEKKLKQAGEPFGWSAADYRMIQLISFTALLLTSFWFLSTHSQPIIKCIIYSILAGMVGFFYPHLYLVDKSKQRITAIEKAMPDFFDMVNVSLEAGLGLDAALMKVCKRIQGPLAQEFLQALDEMKFGKSRRDAFTDLKNRVSSDLFHGLMGALIQADQFGIGMGSVLRAQTRRLREQRRQRAREKSMKAPVKMTIPMVLLIFPSLFIVILGSLIVQVFTKLL